MPDRRESALHPAIGIFLSKVIESDFKRAPFSYWEVKGLQTGSLGSVAWHWWQAGFLEGFCSHTPCWTSLAVRDQVCYVEVCQMLLRQSILRSYRGMNYSYTMFRSRGNDQRVQATGQLKDCVWGQLKDRVGNLVRFREKGPRPKYLKQWYVGQM